MLINVTFSLRDCPTTGLVSTSVSQLIPDCRSLGRCASEALEDKVALLLGARGWYISGEDANAS